MAGDYAAVDSQINGKTESVNDDYFKAAFFIKIGSLQQF